MAEKSKILIIGGTGYIGKFVVEASAKSGHPTFALVRESTVSDPVKGKLIEGFKNSGVTLVHGDLHNHESLVKAIKQVDVVISTVGSMQLADQTKIIAAIKEAGNIKRFLPSEFGNDVDRLHVVEPAKSTFAVKVQIRRTIEAEGIPYTYVSSNYFAGYFLPTLAQPGVFAPPPPRDKAIIPGDGNPKDDLEDEEVGNSLISVLRRILATPKTKKEDWRRTAIFQILVNCGNQARKLIIDGGSSVNAVSATTVERLKLPIQPHPYPYKVAWIDNTSIRVTQRCLVSFSYGSYNDSIWCDVIPMNVTHILLGRPWLYDRDVQHSGRKNTYAFSFKNKEIVLKPMTTDAMGKIKEQLSLKEQLSQLVLVMTTDVKYTTGEEYLSVCLRNHIICSSWC